MNARDDLQDPARTLQVAAIALNRIKQALDALNLESSESLHETLYGLDLALIGTTRLFLEMDMDDGETARRGLSH
jgi:hypothetical protein